MMNDRQVVLIHHSSFPYDQLECPRSRRAVHRRGAKSAPSLHEHRPRHKARSLRDSRPVRRGLTGVGRLTATPVTKMIDERHDADFIANVASNLLSKKFEARIRLRKGKTFTTGASIVVRCEVLDVRPNLPASFIIKKVREDEFRYQPDNPETPNSAHWLFNDWAAAEFLNNVPSEIPLSPVLYGGS